jgi:hypothetical protein
MAVAESSLSAYALYDRWESLNSRMQTQLTRWRDIADLGWPAKSDILRGDSGYYDDARDRTLELYDPTMLRSRRLLAGNLQAAVTNPALQWFRLRFRRDEVNEDAQVGSWLSAVDDLMLLSYNSSNAYAEFFQHYAQLAAFGTAATFINQRQDLWLDHGTFALRFQTLYPGTYVIAEGQHGQVDTLMRKLYFSPRQAMQRWGNEAPERVRRIMGTTMNGRPMVSRIDEREPYVHIVCPREDRHYGKEDNRNMPFADVVIDCDSKDLVAESGWEEFPFVVSRWEREGLSAWGYGPGHEALSDARTLNRLIELWLQMAELMVQPPLQVLNQAFTGVLRFAPLHINIVEQRDAVTPMNVQGNPSQIPLEIARLQKSIRDAFYVDDLLALPPPDATGKMTATEVAQRIALMQQYMGPVFTMLLSDFLDPLADRVFGLGLRAKIFPPAPTAVLLEAQRAGGQLDVEYDGPLARSQRIGEVTAFDDLLTLGDKMTAVTQTTSWQDNFDLDKGIRNAATILGIRRDQLRDPRAVRQIRQTREQQAAMMQQAQLLREGAAALKDGAAGIQGLQEVAA